MLDALGLSSAEIDLVFVSDSEIAKYNEKYLRRRGPTDVMAFPMNEPGLLGAVVISTDTATRQAKDEGHSLWDELKILIVHGVLHLVGYDHKGEGDGRKMKRKEKKLLKLVEKV